MQRTVARIPLAKIFEQYATLDLNWNNEEERKQLRAQLQNTVAAVEEAKPTKLASKDVFIIIDMYVRLGQLLENEAAMRAFQTAYELLQVDSVKRIFKWYLFAARIRYCQAKLDIKVADRFENYCFESCLLMRRVFADCVIDMDEFREIDSLYGQVMDLLLTQRSLSLASENARTMLTTLIHWAERTECNFLLKRQLVMFANNLAKLYFNHRFIEQAEEFLQQAKAFADKLLIEPTPGNDRVRMEICYLFGLWCELEDKSDLAYDYYKRGWELGIPHHHQEISDEFIRFILIVLDAYLQMQPDFSALSEGRELAAIGLKLTMGIKNMRAEDFNSILKCFSYLRDTHLPYHFEYHVYQFGVDFFSNANSATPKVLMTLVEGVKREANQKSAAQALILLLEHVDVYVVFPEYKESEMGRSLKKHEHRQQFSDISNRLNNLIRPQVFIPHAPASVSPRKASSFFSQK